MSEQTLLFTADDNIDSDEVAPPIDSEQRNDELYKKWFRSRDRVGFLSLRHWLTAGKVAIDIGEASGGSLTGATMVWTNALALASYLRAVSSGQGQLIYPAGKQPAESYIYYGGGSDKDGKPISRVLKVVYWTADDPSSGFAWKTGHFPATRTSTGAYQPDMSSPISTNLIKISRAEMAEMSLRLELALQAFAVGRDPGEVLASLSGTRR